MGTKLSPGAFDCLGDAEPNEPFFTLLGRDMHAAKLVRMWAKERAEAISRGDYPAVDALKVTEAYECAAKMEEYRAGRERRLQEIGAKPRRKGQGMPGVSEAGGDAAIAKPGACPERGDAGHYFRDGACIWCDQIDPLAVNP